MDAPSWQRVNDNVELVTAVLRSTSRTAVFFPLQDEAKYAQVRLNTRGIASRIHASDFLPDEWELHCWKVT